MLFENMRVDFRNNFSKSFDIRIVCEDETFHVDKRLLSSKSKFFNAMFSNFKESSQTEIKLENIPKKAFLWFLDFLYFGFLEPKTTSEFDFAVEMCEYFQCDELNDKLKNKTRIFLKAKEEIKKDNLAFFKALELCMVEGAFENLLSKREKNKYQVYEERYRNDLDMTIPEGAVSNVVEGAGDGMRACIEAFIDLKRFDDVDKLIGLYTHTKKFLSKMLRKTTTNHECDTFQYLLEKVVYKGKPYISPYFIDCKVCKGKIFEWEKTVAKILEVLRTNQKRGTVKFNKSFLIEEACINEKDIDRIEIPEESLIWLRRYRGENPFTILF